jgi:hypothetical protein
MGVWDNCNANTGSSTSLRFFRFVEISEQNERSNELLRCDDQILVRCHKRSDQHSEVLCLSIKSHWLLFNWISTNRSLKKTGRPGQRFPDVIYIHRGRLNLLQIRDSHREITRCLMCSQISATRFRQMLVLRLNQITCLV